MKPRVHAKKLNIWMNGLLVGCWEKAREGERFAYFNAWMRHPQGRALSLSLPFTPSNQGYRGALVSDFFDNLLPDSDAIRRRLAQRFQTGGTEPFSLLAALGRDCVGAIQLLPVDEGPVELRAITGRALADSDVAQLLRHATDAAPLGRSQHDADLRLSIAGAQEKTALLRHEGKWVLPGGSTPTTHIFKLPLGLVGNMQADMRTSVENEWLCSKIVAAYGLPVAHTEIGQFDDQKALIVERFDRRLADDGSWIMRLPQEDMCQATGTSSLKKYQVDGGPGIQTIMALLDGSARAAQDRRAFFKTQIVFWLLAAIDGHAKNFSIAHLPGGRFHSTPLYDILSAHSVMGSGRNQLARQKAKMAMAVRGGSNHYLIDTIERRHWLAQARQAGIGEKMAQELIEEVTGATQQALATVAGLLPAQFPPALADAIFDGVRRHSARLAAMPSV